MPMLTAVSQIQPDYVALAMVIVLAGYVIAAVLRKRKKKKSGSVETLESQTATQSRGTPAPGSAGQIKLYRVEPRTAAMIMAIVAHRTGKPLNELRFISIKEVTES